MALKLCLEKSDKGTCRYDSSSKHFFGKYLLFDQVTHAHTCWSIELIYKVKLLMDHLNHSYHLRNKHFSSKKVSNSVMTFLK